MIVSLLFLLLQSVLVFSRPRYFLLMFVIYNSSFFGFLPKEILLDGNDIGLFYQTFLMILCYFYLIKRIKMVPKHLQYLLNTILLLYIFGVCLPVINGSSSILQSVIASKEFSSLFLLHYLVIHRKWLFQSYLEKILAFFGYYFLFILLLFLIFNYIPPEYIKESGGIEFDYPTILSLFLFVVSARATALPRKFFVLGLILIWTIGMFYEGHIAIMITTTLGCTIILFRFALMRFVKQLKTLLLGVVLVALSLFLLPMERIINSIFTSSAFISRSIYNEQRFEMIGKSPLFGYGFLHKSAFQLNDSNVYMESLSFIDSGYVDLLGKFGILGMTIYLVFFSIPFFRGRTDILSISLRVFFLQYFLVTVTWSVFTYSMGTVALSLALFMYYINGEYLNFKKGEKV